MNVFARALFCSVCSGVGAGLAFLWDVHGEAPQRKHPAGRQAVKPRSQNLHLHQGPLRTHSEFELVFSLHLTLTLLFFNFPLLLFVLPLLVNTI